MEGSTINKLFVPYEESLELKELGFDEPCFGRFYTKPKCKIFSVDEKGRYYKIKNTPKKLYTVGEYFVLNDDNAIIAPIYSQAFRWFRDKYKLQSYIRHECSNVEYYYDFVINEDVYDVIKDTYEEAELACLRKLIDIVKKK